MSWGTLIQQISHQYNKLNTKQRKQLYTTKKNKEEKRRRKEK